MNKSLFFAIFVVLLCISNLNAQTSEEAFNYSSSGVFGSARYVSMAGAFGSLGADLSSISNNPASAAVFLLPEIGLSQEISASETLVLGETRNGKINLSDSSLNQFGFVIPFRNINDGPFKLLNFSLNIQKEQDFKNQISSIATRGIGLDQFFTNNAQGVPLDNLETRENETLNDLYVFLGNNQGYAVQQAFLGYNTYLFDPISNDLNNSNYISAASYDQVEHDYYVNKTGDHKKYSWTIATQYNNSIYIGVSINTHDIYSYELSNIVETGFNENSEIQRVHFNNELIVEGNGISAQIGLIGKLQNNIRLGLTYQSATKFSMIETSNQQLAVDRYEDQILLRNEVNPNTSNISEYDFSIPSRTSLSLSYIFGSNGILSTEYSFKNYGNMNFQSGSNQYLRSLNNEISSSYKNASLIKIGGEYRIKALSVRSGYYSEENSLIIGNNSQSALTFGLGYNFGASLLSLGLINSKININRSLITSGINDNILAEKKHTILVISYNFKL
tara:strand:- start:11080 stop:12591 length:1512 start_codon:yes stop_codon:yes gene_type:complete